MSLLNPGVGSSGSGTQYTDGASTISHPTGTIAVAATVDVWIDYYQ